MTIPRIRIDQQTAQIGVRGGPAALQMSIPNAQIQIQKSDPELTVDTQIPTFRGNRQRVSNESGLKDPLTLAKDFRNKGRQAALNAAATYKNEGNFIANPGIPGDKSIPMMVRNKMRQFFQKPDFNVGLMPSSIPSLNWDKGHINVSFSRHNISIDRAGSITPQITANINFPVDVFISRQPYVRVSVEQVTIGRHIDRTV
ncbi:MAG: DUF6470 family protein [Oscillospiraceae bacterium]|nr:DUF6470 family protein [Oscillospiraceae bacterium]